jgi:hypothetical protein
MDAAAHFANSVTASIKRKLKNMILLCQQVQVTNYSAASAAITG